MKKIIIIALLLAVCAPVFGQAARVQETNILAWNGSAWARLTKGYLLTAQTPAHATLAIGGGYGDTGLSVTAAGNLSTNGTLAVDGASTLTGAVGITGNLAVNTNKFNVTAATGATATASTITSGVNGAGGSAGGITVRDGANPGTNTFTVAGATGNTVVAGTLAVTGELTGAGPKYYISVPLNSTAAATTAYTGVVAVHRAITITKASVAFVAYPGSNAGTCVIKLTNTDASGGPADDNLLSAVSIDVKAKAAKSVTDLTLTATGADLVLADGDYVYASLINDNADATAGTGGVLTIEYTLQ